MRHRRRYAESRIMPNQSETEWFHGYGIRVSRHLIARGMRHSPASVEDLHQGRIARQHHRRPARPVQRGDDKAAHRGCAQSSDRVAQTRTVTATGVASLIINGRTAKLCRIIERRSSSWCGFNVVIRHNPGFGIAPQIVGGEPGDADFGRVLAEHLPDDLFSQALA